MKFTIQLLCLVGALTVTIGSPLPGEPILDLEAIAKMTPEELDALAGGLAAEELIRTKRSGSGDILGTVSKTLSSGLSSKIGFIASASSGASSLISSASSKGHSDHGGYTYSEPSHTKSFDFWSLKKSILNTLFQAVKAITGGVTILNGQLIKGGGALASGVGKLISIKGDAVTNLGRHIVSSATLVPPKKKHIVAAVPAPIAHHHHAPAPIHISAPGPIHPSGPSIPVSSYGPPTAPAHFSAPSGPAAHFPSSAGHFAPSTAPAHVYGPAISHNSLLGGLPSKYSHSYEGRGKHTGVQAGLIVLQPLDMPHHGTANHATHSASPGASTSFISSALEALKGIIGGNGNSGPADHTAPAASAPSGAAQVPDYKDPIFHPPPPVSGADSSYNSYSHQNAIPSFKPLDSTTGHDGKPSGLVTSYGTPIRYDTDLSNSVNMQSMVDHLAESQLNSLGLGQQNPTFNAYLDSFSDSQGEYSQKGDEAVNIPGPLNLKELNKITKNLNKVQQRSDSLVAESTNTKSQIEKIRELARTMALNELITNFKMLSTTNPPETTVDVPRNEPKLSVKVEKSVSYELRGNRVVRLTDSIGDA